MINTGSKDPLADKTWRCVSQNCSDKTDKIYVKTKVFTCCHQYLGFLEHGNVNIMVNVPSRQFWNNTMCNKNMLVFIWYTVHPRNSLKPIQHHQWIPSQAPPDCPLSTCWLRYICWTKVRNNLAHWWFQPPWKIWVRQWERLSDILWKKMFQTTNQLD